MCIGGHDEPTSSRVTSHEVAWQVPGQHSTQSNGIIIPDAERIWAASVGDTFTFLWNGTEHSLDQLKDKAHFETCNFTDAVGLGYKTTSSSIVFTVPAAGRYFLSCPI